MTDSSGRWPTWNDVTNWVSNAWSWVCENSAEILEEALSDISPIYNDIEAVIGKKIITGETLTDEDRYAKIDKSNEMIINAVAMGGVRGPSSLSIPKNMSPIGAGRSGAFNAAKESLGIPRSQQPLQVLPNVNKQGKIVPGRVYDFGNGKLIRDDVMGHQFPDGVSFGRHFNVDSAGKLHFFY